MFWRTPSRPKRRGWPSRIGRATAACAILLLAFIGFLHLTRGSAVRHVLGVGLGGDPVPVTHAAFLSNVDMLTGASVADGHHVELALNGDGTFERLFTDLAAARSSIMLQVYYGNSGRLAERLGQLLIDRARAGVAVLVLYDAFGTSALSDEYLQTLRDAGVRVELFRPLTLSTLHLVQTGSPVRGIVIDGRIAWTGGFGIDGKWLGDGRTNDEATLMVHDATPSGNGPGGIASPNRRSGCSRVCSDDGRAAA